MMFPQCEKRESERVNCQPSEAVSDVLFLFVREK